MPEIATIVIILIVGFVAGVVNTLAGGGSLLTLPLLIFLGLPPTIANGTNRIAIWVQCVSAVSAFQKKKITSHRYAILFGIPSIIGSIIGAQLAVEISDTLFQYVLAGIMIVMAALIVWNPKPTGHIPAKLKGWRLAFAFLTFFLIGIYGGFIQAGVGYFFIAALTLLCGFDLITTTLLKVYIIAIYMTFAIIVFMINDQIYWSYAIMLSIGNAFGGWLGTQIAVFKGDKWIRIILVISVIFMALKLLGILPTF